MPSSDFDPPTHHSLKLYAHHTQSNDALQLVLTNIHVCRCTVCDLWICMPFLSCSALRLNMMCLYDVIL